MRRPNSLFSASFRRLPGGALLRAPNVEEEQWFAAHKNVAGFACCDGTVVINPFTKLRHRQVASVVVNEAARVFLARYPRLCPPFALTLEQKRRFFDYGPIESQRHTIIARIVARDSSAGNPTLIQKKIAKAISDAIRLKQFYDSGQWRRVSSMLYNRRVSAI